jgi:S1-C subfamily serine protease
VTRLARRLGLAQTTGAFITAVDTSGPGAAAGLRDRDIIVALADRVIEGVDDLHRVLTEHAHAAVVEGRLVREGSVQRFSVRPGPDRLRATGS